MNKQIFYGFIPLILAMLVIGCATAEPGKSLGVKFNTVALIDDGLDMKVKAQTTNAKRSPTGTVEAWAVLKNLTNEQIMVEGRVWFFDQDEQPVEGPTAWKRLFIPPNSMATYRELSTKVMEIGYYYIEVREGR
jgi:uncharacterized protein YcfL